MFKLRNASVVSPIAWGMKSKDSLEFERRVFLLDNRRPVRGADGARRDGDGSQRAEILAAVGPHAVLHVLPKVLLRLNALLNGERKD